MPSTAAPSASRAEAERIKQLVFELQRVHGQVSAKQVEVNTLMRERDALRARLDRELNQHPRLAELETTLATRDARLAELETTLATRDARLAELERLISVPNTHESSKPNAEGLRAIRGVGPGYERALRALGITTLAQVAEWTDAQVVAIASQIRTRPERIVRDDWVGQARRLLSS